MNYFYTAIFQPSTGKIMYPEHFEAESERDKRAKQLESESRRMSPPDDDDGKPHDDTWLCYSGVEAVETYLIRIGTPLIDSEKSTEGVSDEKETSKRQAYHERVDNMVAKVRTISALTAPEFDDRKESRQLPAWAIAQSAMEKAAQAVIDAKQGADALQLRADNLAEAAYSRASDGPPRGVNELAESRRKAVDAQTQADHEKARLYHAEQDYLSKSEEFKALFEADQIASATRAKEAQKK